MKTIKILMMMVSALVVCSCSNDDDDDDYFDDPQDHVTGFVLSYDKLDIDGMMSACSETNRPTVMYDSCKVEYSYKSLSYNYYDGTRKTEKCCHMIAVKSSELGDTYADSLVFSPDSTSFWADGYYQYKNGRKIPAKLYSYDMVEGKPVKVAVEFVHPDYGKTEYVFYRYEK